MSTDTVPVGNIEEFWQVNASELFGRLELETRSDEHFYGRCTHANIDDLVLCKLASGPHRITRTATSARQYDRGYLKAFLQIRGTSLLDQDDRTTLIEPGEWSLYDTARPYHLTVLEESEMLLLLLPRERLYTPQSNLRRLTVRKFSARAGVGKLACQFAHVAFDEVATLNISQSVDVADSISQMIRLAVHDTLSVNVTPPSSEMLCERIKSYVTSHLRNPELSIDDVAKAIRCTKRYLHKTFEKEELSISEYILRQRLERCRQQLLDSGCADRSITDIAFSWGFNNSNHFSRCFKEAFGMSPRAVRPGPTAT
ncbi:helix-turn-helix domain-containing protein [Tunturiibacter empetritectus]|uniref:helix-turn-helix domain-containing protein n=1 Tax=Tunturiibacter empetritectus TaxID=3069691 RepID=UPI00211C5317|nr:helix-turn-helix domain-containing protein [Edaphobacter lichenicola]